MRPPNLCTLCRVLLVLLLCAERCVAVKWLALYRVRRNPWTRTRNCSRSVGLVSRQTRICRNNLDLMPTVTESALLSIETCQAQFSDRRWNCSSILGMPSMSRDLARGTREQAYVYGIASAALVHSVSRACSISITTKCSCGALPNSPTGGTFKWGGCGDDVRFGLVFGEAFTDATLKSKKGKAKSSKKALLNRHNFRVGRKMVASSLIRVCKCHGVSGSCSIRTCWMGLPSFSAIGKALKDRYAVAVEVRRKRRKKVKILMPTRTRGKPFKIDDLAFYEKSPDYCSPDAKTGSLGTHGRLCDARTPGHGHCDAMCCGRGHDDFTMQVTERCECKYYWCCYVKCKTCVKTLNLSKCR